MEKRKFVISEPKEFALGSEPGLMIELTEDESLIEIYHFYYEEEGKVSTTQIVGIKPGELACVRTILEDFRVHLLGLKK